MSRAIVTGGAGFVGSHLVHRLLTEGWEVVVIDNLSSGKEENVPDGATLEQLDVANEEQVGHLDARRVDAVFHLASHVGGELSFEQPLLDFRSNALGTMVMLNWALAAGVPKFVFAGSMAVYGDPPSGQAVEDAPLRPKTPYGAAKAAGEHLCGVFAERLDITVLRLFNVYGPGQDLGNLKQGMVSIFMAMVATGGPVDVHGAAERFRDLVFVDDVVEAFMLALSPQARGRTYNVGTGRKTTVGELVGCIVAAFDHDPATFPVHYGEGTPGDQFGIYADISALRSELGFEPRNNLADGIERMVAWVREHV